ncbi:uncharacterized protein CDAR_387521 [Caerostris darwini]|uniref:Uncharacterized protein n=1 Tax=Caerostris darwini TaxID=1538125 RepID=A0AAV4TPM1_9ARAC|nr:uncharacterized protein CDAR_387521 [Caerostris darwini]
MPTTKLNLEQQSSSVVTNGSANISLNSSSEIETHLSTVSNNVPTSTNGTHERHVSSSGDDKSTFTSSDSDKSMLTKFNSVQKCDPSLSSTTKLLGDPGLINGDIPSKNRNGTVNSDKDFNTSISNDSSRQSSYSPRTKSPELKVKFIDGINNIPPTTQMDNNGAAISELANDSKSSNGATGCDTKLDSPTEGAIGGNPTLWLGEDQMLLLPGKSQTEETDSNSGTSETKSFEGLLSPNGTSILWDEDTDWILLFDNMIRYADRKQQRTTRSCGCKGCVHNGLEMGDFL